MVLPSISFNWANFSPLRDTKTHFGKAKGKVFEKLKNSISLSDCFQQCKIQKGQSRQGILTFLSKIPLP